MCSDNLYPCVVKCPSRKVLDAHCRNQKVVASSQHTFQEKITMKFTSIPTNYLKSKQYTEVIKEHKAELENISK